MNFDDLKSRLPSALDGKPEAAPEIGKHAAVLMAIEEVGSGPRLWLIRRPDTMRRHGGQVAFPGGKFDEADGTLEATALREASEEIGIIPDNVTVLGALEDVVVGFTGVVVTPYVGWLHAPLFPVPNDHEVARVFTLGVEEAVRALETVHPLVGVELDGERLWGASAWMVKRLGAAIRRAR